MFGNLNKPAFGSTAPSTTFGFGTSTAANANPFGQNQLFGKTATGGFGSPSTSTFGQPANTSIFPSTQPQSSNIFQNSNTTFGSPQTAQTGFGTNLFGQQQPSTSGGLFNNTSTFGQQSKPTGFGFGATQSQPSLFGQQPQQGQTASLFQPSSGNLFGTGSTFGAQQTGTVIKFNAVTGTDTMMKNGVAQSINTKHHSITCMKEYENKSFEELRFEDYQANRKGPQQQPGFGSTAFGATATSTNSLFGQQQDPSKPAFGQTAGFGQTAPTFGQPTTGFGMTNQNNAATSSLFNKPTAFGAPTSSSNTFGFNATQNANPFGANQANKPFGAATQPLFGAATSQPGQTPGFGSGIFGQTNTQNSNTTMFGKPAPTTGFNQPQNTGFSFNAPASTQASSLFQNNKPNLFGQTNTTPGFGQTNTFGQAGQTSFGANFGKPAAPSFGQTNQTGFGTTLGAGLNTQNTSLFGNTANKPGGLFGNTGNTSLFGTTTTPFQSTPGFGLQNQQQQMMFPPPDQTETKNLALITSDPFGDAPHLAGLVPKTRSEAQTQITTNPSELKSLLDASKKVDMTHNSKLKVYPLKSLKTTLFDVTYKNNHQTDTNGIPDAQMQQTTNCRRLVIKSRTESLNNSKNSTDILNVLNTSDSVVNNIKSPNNQTSTSDKNDNLEITPQRPSLFGLRNDNNVNQMNENDTTPSKPNNRENLFQFDDDEPATPTESVKNYPCGIICTRPEYYTLPSLEELSKYVDNNGSCIVKGFTIGRKGYGNVYFPEEMDVANLNIDELVHFRYREINVYPDESKKPPVGQGLNRKAQVTLDNVFPRRNGSNELINDVNELLQMKFAEKLRRVTVKKDAKFVDYRPETGSWVFKVDHFSKYGYNDSDEESDENGEKKKDKTVKKPEEITPLNNIAPAKDLKDAPKPTEQEGTDLVKFPLDKDAFIDEDEQSGSDEDVLATSMYVDMSEEAFPTHLSNDFPMHVPYDTYKTSKSIQVMKSTLFGDDDRSSDDVSSHASIIKQYLDLPEEFPKTMPVIQEETVIRKRPLLRPKVDKVYNYAGVEFEDGYVMPSRSYMDIGIFKGKSFKVGWQKGFNFITVNNKIRQISINNINLNQKHTTDVINNVLQNALETVLEESSFQLNNKNIPTYKINKGESYLQKQVNLFEELSIDCNNSESKYMESIWKLCEALWGTREENTIANRRYLLSEWLKFNTSNEIDQEMNSLSKSAADTIFNLLSVFKVYEAADFAMDNKFPNLSLLISQLCLTNKTKLFLQEQIELWYNSLTSNHITDDVKKIYLLLSGLPNREDINVFENVDWKRAFGMHLWYICPNGAPVETAVELYKNAFETHGYAEKPLPPYCNRFNEDNPFDILYHILLLYKSRIHRLSSVLNPATYTDNPLDYRLSWLLLQLFHSLDVGLIDNNEKVKITTSFSNQLENLGMWDWSIFVLLYLEDNVLKKNLIMGILDRNLSPEVNKETQNVQNNLVNNMNIPPEWIHKVKAEKLLLMKRYYEAFNHFTHAGEYIKANEILIEHLLPNLFINEQYDIIKLLIDLIQPGSCDILKWNSEAGLFLDFIDLQEKVITANEDDMLRLLVKLQSISERISVFPFENDQQKLCIAEVAKRSATVFKELCKRLNNKRVKSAYNDFIDGLEMPPDFKQNEGLYMIS